jgi:outer membrane immunogenic protein
VKKLALAAAAASALLTGAASAADLAPRYTKAAPLAAPAYDWSGFYLGVNLGGAAVGGDLTTDQSNNIGPGSDQHFAAGVTGGVQGGYNWQVAPSWVLGIEGDFNGLSNKSSFCDINDCFAPNDFLIFTTRTNWLSTVRGRVGYAWDRSMLYVTGGVAFADVRDSFNFFSTTDIASNHQTRSGYAVGGGLETALMPNLTLKAEYLFADVGKDRVFLNPGDGFGFVDFQHKYQIGRIGLNYRFGGFGAPVVAKY